MPACRRAHPCPRRAEGASAPFRPDRPGGAPPIPHPASARPSAVQRWRAGARAPAPPCREPPCRRSGPHSPRAAAPPAHRTARQQSARPPAKPRPAGHAVHGWPPAENPPPTAGATARTAAPRCPLRRSPRTAGRPLREKGPRPPARVSPLPPARQSPSAPSSPLSSSITCPASVSAAWHAAAAQPCAASRVGRRSSTTKVVSPLRRDTAAACSRPP